MTQEQINQAFEGRWRIKGNYGQISQNIATLSSPELYEHIKGMCRDFFTAGILLSDKAAVPEVSTSATYNDVCDISCPFENFWDAYDKKVGKPKCEKLWHKLSMNERVACLNYIPLYKQAQPDKQYRKNPETFLRNKSWNDELIYRNGTDKPSLNEQRKDKLASILTE